MANNKKLVPIFLLSALMLSACSNEIIAKPTNYDDPLIVGRHRYKRLEVVYRQRNYIGEYVVRQASHLIINVCLVIGYSCLSYVQSVLFDVKVRWGYASLDHH